MAAAAATTRTILVVIFASTLLFFTVTYFTSVSQLSSSPILAKFFSLFNNNTINDRISSTFDDQQDQSKQMERTLPVEQDQVEQMASTLPAAFDDKDVVVLTQNNFSNFIAGNQYVMLNFYASWCYFSQKLAPAYAAAATTLKANKAVLAKIDCTQESELARKFKIKGYPTMYFLVNGVHQVLYDFQEERTRHAIVNWVNQKMNITVQSLTTMKEAEHILAVKSVVVLGFLDTLEGPENTELAAVSRLYLDVDFYQTANLDVAKLLHIDDEIKRPALVLLKREFENHTHFFHEGEFSRSAIADFVSTYKASAVITFTIEEASNIFEIPKKQLWLFTPGPSCEVLSIFTDAANAFRGKLLFVHVEIGDEVSIGRNLAYKFGVTDDAPRVVAYYSTKGGSKKHMYHDELTLNGIKSFAEEFLEGKFMTRTDTSMKTLLRLPSHSHTSDPSSLPHTY